MPALRTGLLLWPARLTVSVDEAWTRAGSRRLHGASVHLSGPSHGKNVAAAQVHIPFRLMSDAFVCMLAGRPPSPGHPHAVMLIVLDARPALTARWCAGSTPQPGQGNAAAGESSGAVPLQHCSV